MTRQYPVYPGSITTTSSLSTSETYVNSSLTAVACLISFQVKDEVYLFSLKGEQVARVAEGFVGACLISGHWDQSWFTVTMHGFTTPGSVGRYDFKAPPEQRFKIIRKTSIKGLVPDDFEATQVSPLAVSPSCLLRPRGGVGVVQQQRRNENSHVYCATQIDPI